MNIEAVVTQYQAALRAFLLSRMSNPADVDDVLQEALTKTFRNFHKLDSSEKIKPWLFQIAHNAMIDHYRRTRRVASVLSEDLWYGDPIETAEHSFEGCVKPFLDALPGEARDLLLAVELEGVSQKQYAEELGVSYSTLKSRVQASRKHLRQLFDECCDIAFASDGSVLDYRQKSPHCKTC